MAHYIRTKLEDSPTYQQMTSTADPAKEAPRPTRLVFKKYKKRLATSIAATMVNSVGFYLVLTYLPTYLTSYTAMEASAASLPPTSRWSRTSSSSSAPERYPTS